MINMKIKDSRHTFLRQEKYRLDILDCLETSILSVLKNLSLYQPRLKCKCSLATGGKNYHKRFFLLEMLMDNFSKKSTYINRSNH